MAGRRGNTSCVRRETPRWLGEHLCSGLPLRQALNYTLKYEMHSEAPSRAFSGKHVGSNVLPEQRFARSLRVSEAAVEATRNFSVPPENYFHPSRSSRTGRWTKYSETCFQDSRIESSLTRSHVEYGRVTLHDLLSGGSQLELCFSFM